MTDRLILFVVDNRDNELNTLRQLKNAGVVNRVEIVRNSQAALDNLFGRDPSELPELVLVDLTVPATGGRKFLEEIRANEPTKRLPVLLLTSDKAKPMKLPEFREAIRMIGIGWLLVREPCP